MKKNNFLSLGAALSAILASLCCIGPAVLSIIGIAGIGAFSFFETYRPLLIALTAVLLAAGFFLVYRKGEVRCEDGSCKIESAGRWNKFTLWVATFGAFLFILFPYVPLSFSQDGQSQNNAQIVQVTIPVKGMTCSGCSMHVESVVKKINGISYVKADFKAGEAVVQFDESKTSVSAVVNQINKETSYRASVPDSTKRKVR
ncbi:cation transporter [bacterium]|nr:cation transporter [bacterium]